MFMGKLFNSLTPYAETKATHTLYAIIVFFPVVYTVVAFLLRYFFGLSLTLSWIILPIIGIIHVRLMEEGRVGFRQMSSSLRLIYIIDTNSRTDELQQVKNDRKNLEKRITEIVEKYAKPDYKTLSPFEGTETVSYTKKLVPTLIRRNSFSGEYL